MVYNSIYDGENTNGPLLYQGFDNGNGDLPYSLSHHNDWELSDEEIFTFTAGAENPTGALTITYIKTDDGWYTNWGFIGEISCSSEPGNNTTCTEEEVSTAGCTDPLACNYDEGQHVTTLLVLMEVAQIRWQVIMMKMRLVMMALVKVKMIGHQNK